MDVEKSQRWPDGDLPESYAAGVKYKDVTKSATGYPDETRPTNFAMFVRKYRSWALSALISLGLVLLTWPGKLQTRAQASSDSEPPRQSTNLTDVVQWDNYTLWLQGQRVFLHSGEFHTFRLPVPDLWLDIFQKMVAAGLNGVRYA
ncbi:hypothetical protein EIP86_000891 [Pleurotus ostreatoroseus]|nr:hypothetical protein EIP86_000891 [Pleurotus ostreatoroseus]